MRHETPRSLIADEGEKPFRSFGFIGVPPFMASLNTYHMPPLCGFRIVTSLVPEITDLT